ncbi:DUF4232 domain-containing protein [Streptomyces sp. NPDC053367]|uniref:DUF4232 domain-containing protein n=1 Tax=Streptomyces sp. NPDC053367 TaxID=3365700 RepID=UPI0037CD8EF0
MRRALISVSAALLLAGAAGCSSSPSGTADGRGERPAPAPSGTASTGAPRTGGSVVPGASGQAPAGKGTATSTGTPTATPSPPPGVLYGTDRLPTPAADHCRTEHLTAVARSTGTGSASVELTNKGPGDCTLRGFPSLLFVGASGRTELPVDWAGAAEDAAEVTLSPGEAAAAGLTFTSLGECEPVTRLDVVPPGESRPLGPAFGNPVRICDTGVRVTAFAPAG